MSLLPYEQSVEESRRLLDELVAGTGVGDGGGGSGGSDSAVFGVRKLGDRYEVSGVSYVGKVWCFGISKVLLNGGQPATQSQHVTFTQNSEFKLAPLPVQIATIISLYEHRGDSGIKGLVDEIVVMLKDDFDVKKPYHVMSTKIVYVPNGLDEIQHWCGYKNAPLVIRKNVKGQSKLLDASCVDFTESVCGTRGVDKLVKSIEWLTGKKPFGYRLDNITQNEERVVLAGCDVSNFIIADYSIDGSGLARGWTAVVGQKKFP